jgi:hypothetical protein
MALDPLSTPVYLAFQRRFSSTNRGSFKRLESAFPNLSRTSSVARGQSAAFSGNTVHNNSSVFSECSFNRLSSTSKLFSPKYSASISVTRGNILSTFSGKFMASEKAKSQSLALVCGLLAIFCFGHTWSGTGQLSRPAGFIVFLCRR